MRCDDARERISAALDGEEPLAREARVHLGGCAACRSWRAEVTELDRLFAAPVTVPRDLLPRVGSRIALFGPRRLAGRALVVALLAAVPAGTAAAKLLDRPARPPARAAAPAPGAHPTTAAPPPRAAATTVATPAAPRPTAAAVPTRPPAPPAGTPAPRESSPPAAAKPYAAERRDGALLLRLTTAATQAGAVAAVLTLTNTGAEPVTYQAPGCADLVVLVDGAAAGPTPGPDCGAFRTVTLAPGETRRVSVREERAPGTYDVSGSLLRVPPPGERAGRLDTPPLRVVVT